MKKSILTLLILIPFQIYGLPLHRVILSTDANEKYIEFWPLVAKAWKEIVGITPTLALIADENVKIDESLGDVIRFEPLPDIPTSLQAQVIRLLLPIYFPEDVCIISDIDMIPLKKSYFVNSITQFPDNRFIIYRDKAYKNTERYPMCYNAAKGKVFSEVFNIYSPAQIPDKIRAWHKKELGWHTDELVLTKKVIKWHTRTNRCVKLGHRTTKRIDRGFWGYDKTLLKKRYYIDAHLPRPYRKFKQKIDVVLNTVTQ